jgi:hypothetical protein
MMERSREPETERVNLTLRKLNTPTSNPPVFLALAETFEIAAKAAGSRDERAHLLRMASSCRHRYEDQRARSDFSPSWERR